MRIALAVAIAAVFLLTTSLADAKSSHGNSSHHSSTSSHSGGSHHSSTSSHSGGSHYSSAPNHSNSSHHSTGHGYAKANPAVKRDANGKIARSEKAKSDFRKSHPCPATGKATGACPGYVIDHKQALKHGGADTPYNMQWQTTAEAKTKDKWE